MGGGGGGGGVLFKKNNAKSDRKLGYMGLNCTSLSNFSICLKLLEKLVRKVFIIRKKS